MADAKDLLQFLERGVGMSLDVGMKLVRIELAPMSPARFRSQRPRLGGGYITIDGAPPHGKAPGGLDFGPASVDEPHHPFPQIQCIGFHAHIVYHAMCQCKYELL